MSASSPPPHRPRDEPTIELHRPVRVDHTRPQRHPGLEQIRGPGAPRTFQLEEGDVTVGRSLQANIPIESGTISRMHLRLERVGPDYRYTDLGSSNGVFLNGVKAHSALLREGDSLQLGDVLFVYHEGR